MSQDNVALIKDRLNITDVISGYIKTQKVGINFKARCPFHNEKTPSFYISPERQIWHCFGCQKGGDMFTFVQEIEGMDFNEALKLLAARAGVELERYSTKEKDSKSELYEICERASKFFEKQLYFSQTGKRALSYLKERGLKEETLKEFRIGFAPNDWRSLSQYLLESGFNQSDIISAGVSLKKEGGSEIYDRFRSRITFPIQDVSGRVVGFTARIFGDNHPADVGKYINTPQTAIYDKSRILYGLDKARTQVRQQNRVLLVEGNIDGIMSYQSGVKNVVATSGTALTPSHLQLLQRYTSNLDLCFDTDQAGSVATRRGIGMALARNFNVSIVQITDPKCKDPADYIEKYGQKWSQVASSGKPAIDYYFDKSRKDLDLSSPSGKKAIVAVLAPLVKRLTSNVEKAHWVSQIATVAKTDEKAVALDIENLRDEFAVYNQDQESSVVNKKPDSKVFQPLDEFQILNQSLLAVVIKKPSLFKNSLAGKDTTVLDPETATAIEIIIASQKPDAFDAMLVSFDDRKKAQLGASYIKSSELLDGFSDSDLKKEFDLIYERLEQMHWQRGIASLVADLKEAEAIGDKSRTGELTKNIRNLINKTSTTSNINAKNKIEKESSKGQKVKSKI